MLIRLPFCVVVLLYFSILQLFSHKEAYAYYNPAEIAQEIEIDNQEKARKGNSHINTTNLPDDLIYSCKQVMKKNIKDYCSDLVSYHYISSLQTCLESDITKQRYASGFAKCIKELKKYNNTARGGNNKNANVRNNRPQIYGGQGLNAVIAGVENGY